MKFYIAIFLLFLTGKSFAERLILISPENQAEYGLEIKTESLEHDKCSVVFDLDKHPSFHAWLTTSTTALSMQEQELRRFLWGASLSPGSKPNSITLLTKIAPTSAFMVQLLYLSDAREAAATGKKELPELITSGKYKKEGVFKDSYFITVSITDESHPYIYLDYPTHTLGGADFFSVELRKFCNR